MVLSLYDDMPVTDFPEDFKDRVLFGAVGEKEVEILKEPTGINLAKLAIDYSDGVILGSENIENELVTYCKDAGLPVLPYNAESIKDGSYIEDYNSFYDNL